MSWAGGDRAVFSNSPDAVSLGTIVSTWKMSCMKCHVKGPRDSAPHFPRCLSIADGIPTAAEGHPGSRSTELGPQPQPLHRPALPSPHKGEDPRSFLPGRTWSPGPDRSCNRLSSDDSTVGAALPASAPRLPSARGLLRGARKLRCAEHGAQGLRGTQGAHPHAATEGLPLLFWPGACALVSTVAPVK